MFICDNSVMHKSEAYFHTWCCILRQAAALNQELDSEQPDMEDIQREEISGKKYKETTLWEVSSYFSTLVCMEIA
jgi:hypothetical protein